MLRPRQLETLANLKKSGIETPEEVIKHCQFKLTIPSREAVRRSANKNRKGRRHSRKYYQEIIGFIKGEQQ